MMPSSGNKDWSAADIERYHQGKMDSEEMHALEKAAMEDPFLADAIEGYQYTSTPLQDLESIKLKLKEKNRKKATPVLSMGGGQWWKVAAIILVIAGGSWLFIRLSETGKNEIALEQHSKPETQKAITKSPVNDSILPEKDTLIQMPSVAKQTNPPAPVTESANTRSLNPSSTLIEEIAPSAPRQNDKVVQSRPRPETNKNQEMIQRDHSIYGNSNTRFNNRVTSANTDSLIAYRNMDAKSRQSEKMFSETDKTSDEENGLARKEKDTTHLNVVMKPDNSNLSEVVVMSTGKKAEASKSARMNIKVDTLEPTVGWAKFDEYVVNNLKRPEELAGKESMTGEVELSFDVNSKGQPINITVTRSLCQLCDEEAIRILKEGPKWKKKKNKKGKVTIKF